VEEWWCGVDGVVAAGRGPGARLPARVRSRETPRVGRRAARCVTTAGTARRRGPPVARPAAAVSLPGQRRKPTGLGGTRLLADPSREVPLRHALRRTGRPAGGRGQLEDRRLRPGCPTAVVVAAGSEG